MKAIGRLGFAWLLLCLGGALLLDGGGADLRSRSRTVAALEAVDYVVIFGEDEPAALIAKILPDVLVKGEDWSHYVSGRDTVEKHGGRDLLLVGHEPDFSVIIRALTGGDVKMAKAGFACILTQQAEKALAPFQRHRHTARPATTLTVASPYPPVSPS